MKEDETLKTNLSNQNLMEYLPWDSYVCLNQEKIQYMLERFSELNIWHCDQWRLAAS